MEDYTTCSSLKEYTFGENLNSRLPLVLFFCFGCAIPDSSMAMVSFPFD